MPSCVPAASPGTRAAAEDAVEETDSIRFTGRGDLARRGTGQEVGVATERPRRALRFPQFSLFLETCAAACTVSCSLTWLQCPATEANTRFQEYAKGLSNILPGAMDRYNCLLRDGEEL